MQLPALLDPDRADEAVDTLRCYYGRGTHSATCHGTFTGARFDTWGHTGIETGSPDRFTADDVIAVSMLAVYIPATAAVDLLDTRADDFARLLEAVGPDRDLVGEVEPWGADWAGWQLWGALRALDGVGPTTASKLYARKRPRLRPIYDSVVAGVLGSTNIWEPLRAHLQARPDLHPHLLELRERAGLPPVVSALRVFDVVTWMEGKGYTHCHRS